MIADDIVKEYLTIVNSLLVLYCFFDIQFSRNWKRYLLIGVLPVVSVGVLYLLKRKDLLAPGDILLNIVACFYVVDEKWLRRIAAFLIGYASNSVILQFIMISLDMMFNRDMVSKLVVNKEILINGVLFIFLIIIIKFRKKTRLNRVETPYLFLTAAILLLCSLPLTYLMLQQKSEQWNMTVKYLISIIFLFAIGISYGLILSNNLTKKYYILNQVKDSYIIMQKEYYKQIYETAIETKKVRHDMKEHLALIQVLLGQKKYIEAIGYIGKLSSEVDKITLNMYDIGDDVVNAVLLHKCNEAHHRGIKISVETVIQSKIQIASFDLCTIIMNLVNNAIEYCEKNNFKNIELLFATYEGHLVIQVINPVAQKIDVVKIQKKSSKSDKDKHGYGLLNVKDTVEKYNGKADFVSTDTEFKVTVTLLKQ